MKTYEQTTAAVLARRDEYIKKAAKRRRIAVSAGIPAVCVIAIVIVFAGMRRTGAFRPGVDAGPSAPDLVTDAGTPPTEPAGNALTEIAPENASRVKSTEAEIITEEPNQVGTPYTLPEDTTGGYIALEPTFVQSDVTVSRAAEPGTVTGTTTHSEGYGGSIGTGYFCIPMIPFDRTIVVTGERITDEEAADYLATHESIRYALLASGVDAEELTFSERGYSHVCYSGIEGEKLEVRVNFRDYLAYSGGKLVAIVTLTKQNGVITDTPAFGGPWFDDYAAFLEAHRGQELVYVYAGSAEIILTPDGEAHSALPGINANAYMEGLNDPYAVFYHPDAVYVP